MTARTAWRLGIVVVAQAMLVLVAVWQPLSARLTGEEVRLAVAPVDPVDPFRGAYVSLDYPDLPLDDQRSLDGPGRGTVYVPLTRSGDLWTGGPVTEERPSGLYLTCDDPGWELRCGIDSLFLSQTRAAAVQEGLRREGGVAVVRVDRWGHAAVVDVETR